MHRFLRILLAPLLCIPAAALNAVAQGTSSPPLEVAYILTPTGIQVYDVDRQTGTPTFEGEAAVPPAFPWVAPSADDHFVYVYGTNAAGAHETFSVYATDSTGMLQPSPIQKFNLPFYVSYFQIDPNGSLAYAVVSEQNSSGQTQVGIMLFTLDPATGKVTSQPRVVATYPPNGPCGAGFTGSFILLGFNPSGNRLYDEWFCVGYDTTMATFYTRQIDLQTGALGPDLVTLFAGGSNGSFSQVNFTPNAILDYYVEADYINNTLYVYAMRGAIDPMFSCTATMLEACGSSFGDTVDPSGQYIFFDLFSGASEITKLDLQAKLIVDTGNSIAYGVRAFSPDSAVIYAQQNYESPFILPIYLFDVSTGAARSGGEIVVRTPAVSVVPALRR